VGATLAAIDDAIRIYRDRRRRPGRRHARSCRSTHTAAMLAAQR
jgi:hypothetical protein